MRVTRGTQTLPISEVPALAAGDRLWIHADLPDTQSARYLMVVAFLRGSTNPPPNLWFAPCRTWEGNCAAEGLVVTVPTGSRQALIFLAPKAPGDFKTLVTTLQDRPGVFVRASQDLRQFSDDRARLETYSNAVRSAGTLDAASLRTVAPLLARSLAIKIDERCLDRILELQTPCLTQRENALVLSDGHRFSLIDALTTGPAGDLAIEASRVPQFNYGYYSPYVASVRDVVRILDSLGTAHYQYIPAVVSRHGDQLTAILNTAPSFHNPKSVVVVPLPPVEESMPPQLKAVDASIVHCLGSPQLVLPVTGSPSAFSGEFAHDMTVTVQSKDGRHTVWRARADAGRGGYRIDAEHRNLSAGSDDVDAGVGLLASLQGFWGFQAFEGPRFRLTDARAQKWEIADRDKYTAIVGREAVVHAAATSASCVSAVTLHAGDGKSIEVEWKRTGLAELEIAMSLKDARPDVMTLSVYQFGALQPQVLTVRSFSEVAHLDAFTIHAGDEYGALTGTRLDEVEKFTVKGVEFTPDQLTTSQHGDALKMVPRDENATFTWDAGDAARVRVTLRDGRSVSINTVVDAPRPSVTLIGKSILESETTSGNQIKLSSQNEVARGRRLSFSVRARSPVSFGSDEMIEVATADDASSILLQIGTGGITRQDDKVAVASLDPDTAFGKSVFGALKFRVVNGEVKGDWQALATLVRLPILDKLKCRANQQGDCELFGANLFLLHSIANNPQFEHSIRVPDGFSASMLNIPRPIHGQLFVKLRDHPSVVERADVEVEEYP